MSAINILYTSHTSEMNMGGQFSLYNLLKRLDRNKYQPILLCPSNGSVSQYFRQIGCPTIFLKFPHVTAANLFKIPFYLISTLRLLRNSHIQIIHSDHPTHTFYMGICARILRVPLIWHTRVSFRSRLDPVNLLLATRVICVSKAVADRFLIRDRVSAKVLIIYNGVDYHKFRPERENGIGKELGLSQSEKVITTIGQMKPEKGMHDFIESAKLISERNTHCRFLMAGTGNDNSLTAIKNLVVSYGLQDHFSCLGFRTDVKSILNATDIFVLASYVEGFPRVVIEAMSCGKPVVGTNVQGVREAVEDGVTGLLVPPRDPESLAKAILNLIEDDRKAKRMGAAGRERVKRFFSIESNVSKVDRLYQETLDKSKRKEETDILHFQG